MKRTNPLLFVFLGFIIFSGCTKKTYDDALPKVQFVSVALHGSNNDSVLITGNVTSSGASPLEYVGFAYSTSPSFDILYNQVLGNGTTGLFYTIVPVHPDSTYYFKCFAANSYGYVASSAFKFTAVPAGPDSAPCSLTSNYIYDQSYGGYSIVGLYTGAGYASYGGSFGVQVDNGTSNETLDICFNGTPANGIYTTVANLSFDSNPYHIAMVVNNANTVNAGGQVYVAVKNGKTTISFCPLTYVASSINYTIDGKISY